MAAWELLEDDSLTFRRKVASEEGLKFDQIQFFARTHKRWRVKKCRHA